MKPHMILMYTFAMESTIVSDFKSLKNGQRSIIGQQVICQKVLYFRNSLRQRQSIQVAKTEKVIWETGREWVDAIP